MSGQSLIPAEALEGLMRKAFLENSVEPGLFWDALLKASLVVPVSMTEGMKPGLQKADGLEEFPVLLGVDAEGNHVLWLFTSARTMADYTEKELAFIELPSMTLLANVRDTDYEVVLIGPERLTLSLHPDLIDSLADGKVPEPLENGETKLVSKSAQVQVGPVVEDPHTLQERFTEVFEDETSVLEATFIQVSDDSGSRLLLGLRLEDESKPNFRRVAGLIAKASEGVLEKGKTLDITLIDGSLREAFSKFGKPFFKR